MLLGRKHTQTCPDIIEIYTYCSTNKQYIEGIQKFRKDYLMRFSKIATSFYIPW